MLELNGTIVTASEVADFYKHHPGFWFLLEVLKKDDQGKAALMRVAGTGVDKDSLREQLMDMYDETDGTYIFVYAATDGKCEIG